MNIESDLILQYNANQQLPLYIWGKKLSSIVVVDDDDDDDQWCSFTTLFCSGLVRALLQRYAKPCEGHIISEKDGGLVSSMHVYSIFIVISRATSNAWTFLCSQHSVYWWTQAICDANVRVFIWSLQHVTSSCTCCINCWIPSPITAQQEQTIIYSFLFSFDFPVSFIHPSKRWLLSSNGISAAVVKANSKHWNLHVKRQSSEKESEKNC